MRGEDDCAPPAVNFVKKEPRQVGLKQIISLQKKSDLKAKTIQKTNDLEAKNKKLVEENKDLQNKLLDKEINDGNKDDTNADFIDLKKKYEKLENTNRDLEKDLTRIRNERNNLKENSAN